MKLFLDRTDAGRRLSDELYDYRRVPGLVVLALPRGGVPVGYEVARALHAPLDVCVVRKLGVPGHGELAMGALASGARVLNEELVRELSIPEAVVAKVIERETQELERQETEFRDGRPPLPLEQKVVLLIDDGLATGSSMRAAAMAVRRRAPSRTVVATPVASSSTCREMSEVADDVVCAETPDPFFAVGLWYGDFSQTSDAEVRDLLARSAGEHEGEHEAKVEGHARDSLAR